jgi:single-strand DNA-binding protein
MGRKGKRFYVEAHLTPDPETGGPRVYQRNDGSWGAAYEATIDVFELVDWPTDEEKAGMGAAPAQEAPAQQQAAQDPPNAVPSDKIPF